LPSYKTTNITGETGMLENCLFTSRLVIPVCDENLAWKGRREMSTPYGTSMQQGRKQPPTDKQNQTWAWQILPQNNLKAALVTSTIVWHLKIEKKKKIDDLYAHGLFHPLSEQLGQSGSEKQNLLERQTYLLALI